MSTDRGFVLYGYWRSSSAWRVRIALHYKNIPFTYVPVNLLKGEHKGPAYLAKNPKGEVPTLEFIHLGSKHYATQSLAIMELLEELEPTPAMLPPGPGNAMQRSDVRAMAQLIASGIQPLQNMSTQKKVRDMGGDDKVWATDFINAGMQSLEAMAKATAGAFLVGNEVSIADACLVPQMYAARRFNADLSAIPTLVRIEAACAALPAFQKAHANAQVDAVAG